jgi:hypothetical protein
VLCAGENLDRFASLINTIGAHQVFKTALHQPIEFTGV